MPILTLCLSLLAVDAPIDTVDTPDVSTEPCAQASWELDGASASVGDGVSYQETWTTTLQQAMICLQRMTYIHACVEVQGQYDAMTFEPAIVATFGSVEAAQQARARARSAQVIKKLVELGVDQIRLRELTPGNEPTVRGVTVALNKECGLGALLSQNIESVSKLESDLADLRASRVQPEDYAKRMATELHRIDTERKSAQPRLPHHLWIDAGVDVGGVVFINEDRNSPWFSPTLRLGLGWLSPWTYLRGQAGVHSASNAEQRLGFEALAAVGYHRSRWIEVGAWGAYRLSTASPDLPLADSMWTLGVEGHQCFYETKLFEICAREAVGGGQHLRQFEVNNGLAERIDPRQSSFFRFDLSLVARVFPLRKDI